MNESFDFIDPVLDWNHVGYVPAHVLFEDEWYGWDFECSWMTEFSLEDS